MGIQYIKFIKIHSDIEKNGASGPIQELIARINQFSEEI